MTHQTRLKLALVLLSIVLILGFIIVKQQLEKPVLTGLDQVCENKAYLLENKRIALLTNQSGIDRFGKSNITCLSTISGLQIKRIFSPEHGFFGNVEAGQNVDSEHLRNIPIISLYGKQKAPKQDQLADVDVLVYDIQDIGLRFYTYISSLGLSMQAAAQAGVDVMVLDRPNPLGNSVQGPTLDLNYKSFVGAYPIPIRYGLSVGQLAQKIVANNWINPTPHLQVISVANHHPNNWFDATGLPWINPSPNIPNLETALVYSGTCLLEATNLNEGRGTDAPFLQFGAPWINAEELSTALNKLDLAGLRFVATQFTPRSIKGKSVSPRYKNQRCQGVRLQVTNKHVVNGPQLGFEIIQMVHKLYPNKLEINQLFLSQLIGKPLDYK